MADAEKPCPSCGHCPTCGNQPPLHPYWVLPYTSPPRYFTVTPHTPFPPQIWC